MFYEISYHMSKVSIFDIILFGIGFWIAFILACKSFMKKGGDISIGEIAKNPSKYTISESPGILYTHIMVNNSCTKCKRLLDNLDCKLCQLKYELNHSLKVAKVSRIVRNDSTNGI